jgi:hypothetical protein
MNQLNKLSDLLPSTMRNRLDPYVEMLGVFLGMRDPKILASLGPSGVRGLLLKRGKQGIASKMPAHHSAHFDWSYPNDNPAMLDLYERAKVGQWTSEQLPWHTSVDPLNPEVALLPDSFLDYDHLARFGVRLDARERRQNNANLCSWMLSQFLHGEQGALFAAAQVTEAVQFFDGKLYGATQVMDEGRHVEVFRKYLDTKLGRLYQINDNLFVIIDALMGDGRWDMKFLGMQIMVEGLALGAFNTLYRTTREPLLRELLSRVIQDEARHVHYGVVALREHMKTALTESERQEREDWAFEVALLMRNRFMAYEIYDESFGHKMSRAQWREFIVQSPGMQRFRRVMFSRLIPNLREIGLMTPRVMSRYAAEGLTQYFSGASADQISADQMLSETEA